MVKRAIDIEKLLHWAYRDELPKRGAAAESVLYDFGALGAAVDSWSDDPSRPSLPAIFGSPHRDALLIEGAVNALAPIEVQWPEARELLAPEFGALLGDDDVTLARLHVPADVYVTYHARMGTRPDWAVERWRLARQIAGNGKVRVDGTGANKRWRDGAKCPVTILPDPREVVGDRAIYVAWHWALGRLAVALGDSLELWKARVPEASPAPWTIPDPQRRILPDLRESAGLQPALAGGAHRVA